MTLFVRDLWRNFELSMTRAVPAIYDRFVGSESGGTLQLIDFLLGVGRMWL